MIKISVLGSMLLLIITGCTSFKENSEIRTIASSDGSSFAGSPPSGWSSFLSGRPPSAGKPPAMENYINVDFKNPIKADLIANSMQYFRTHSFGTSSNLSLSAAEPLEFYTIDKFHDQGKNPVGPKILGIFKIKREDGVMAKFGLVMSDTGLPLTIYGAQDRNDNEYSKCVPFFLYNLGTYSVYYQNSVMDHDPVVIRNSVINSLVYVLEDKNLLSNSEDLTMGLQPIMDRDRYDSQQSFGISGGKKLYENEITEAVKRIRPAGAKNIFISLALAAGPYSVSGRVTCKLVNK